MTAGEVIVTTFCLLIILATIIVGAFWWLIDRITKKEREKWNSPTDTKN